MTKASDNPYPSLLAVEQGSDPSTPAAGRRRLYPKSDGWYDIDDAGAVTGPFGPGGGGGGSFAGARVYHNANQSIANNTATSLAFNSERSDTDAFHDPSTNNSRLTVPTGLGGTYLITGHVQFGSNTTGLRAIYILLNGTTVIADHEMITNASDPRRFSIATAYPLVQGDYVELGVYQNSGGALNVEVSANRSPEFSISLLGA